MSLQGQNNEVTSHLNVAKKGQPAPQTALGSSPPRIVLSQIESAVAFMPVLAVRESVTLNHESQPSGGCRTVKRSDLAARLGVDANRPIGAQLAANGQMSSNEAQLVDGGYFRGRSLMLDLRMENSNHDAGALLEELKSKKLIDKVEGTKEESKYAFVQLRTGKFIELANALAEKNDNSATLVSINDSILLM